MSLAIQRVARKLNWRDWITTSAVFIDAGYIEKIFESHFPGEKIDYGKISKFFNDTGDDVLRTYYYYCPPFQSNPPTPEERRNKSGYDSFKFNLLRLSRFEVREGKLKRARGGRLEQKGVDTLICVDMVKLVFSGKIGKVILISGDHDLLPGIKAIKEVMVITTLVSHPTSISDELFALCDDRIEINQGFVDSIKRDQ